MPAIEGFIGAAQNVFCGLASSNTPLQVIRSKRTEGLGCQEEVPRTFIPFLNEYVLSGLITVTANLVFYGTDSAIYNIARGKHPNDDPNTGPSNVRYSILAVFPSQTIARCFYFPDVSTTSPLNTGLYKQRPTTIPITLNGADENPDTILVYKGTIAQMATIMGAKFPNLAY